MFKVDDQVEFKKNSGEIVVGRITKIEMVGGERWIHIHPPEEKGQYIRLEDEITKID